MRAAASPCRRLVSKCCWRQSIRGRHQPLLLTKTLLLTHVAPLRSDWFSALIHANTSSLTVYRPPARAPPSWAPAAPAAPAAPYKPFIPGGKRARPHAERFCLINKSVHHKLKKKKRANSLVYVAKSDKTDFFELQFCLKVFQTHMWHWYLTWFNPSWTILRLSLVKHIVSNCFHKHNVYRSNRQWQTTTVLCIRVYSVTNTFRYFYWFCWQQQVVVWELILIHFGNRNGN